MRLVVALSFSILLPACAEEAAERPAAMPERPSVVVTVARTDSDARAGLENAAGPDDMNSARVLVTPDRRLDRPTELLGVLDFHTAAASEDKGFDELRRKAAAMGGDAVIGAEFEHGEGSEPSHLSGMVVRYR